VFNANSSFKSVIIIEGGGDVRFSSLFYQVSDMNWALVASVWRELYGHPITRSCCAIVLSTGDPLHLSALYTLALIGLRYEVFFKPYSTIGLVTWWWLICIGHFLIWPLV